MRTNGRASIGRIRLWGMLVAGALGGRALAADALPTVASINLCADQLVLSLADAEQILSVSWLSADREESMLFERAREHALNYGSAEEIIRIAPDVVIAGAYTNAFTRQLLRDQGFNVVDIEPAINVADIARNLEIVAAALHKSDLADSMIASLQEEFENIRASAGSAPVKAVVVRPGGFTAERPSLADTLLTSAGLTNVTADSGLDRWGSLSMETLLTSRPDLIVIADYRPDEPSLANAVLAHPVLKHFNADIATVAIESRLWSCGLPQSLESAGTLAAAGRLVRQTRRIATADSAAENTAGGSR